MEWMRKNFSLLSWIAVFSGIFTWFAGYVFALMLRGPLALIPLEAALIIGPLLALVTAVVSICLVVIGRKKVNGASRSTLLPSIGFALAFSYLGLKGYFLISLITSKSP